MSATLKIADVVLESVVDGLGLRMTLFVQGCNHRCKGCHNSQTWDFCGGQDMTAEEIIALAKTNPLIDGMTFSGGEPFEQAAGLAEIAAWLKSKDLNVWCYSGYTLNELLIKAETDKGAALLLALTDVLVDGKFIEEEKNLMLKFRGSTNQRIIDMNASRASGYKQVVWLSGMRD